MSEYLTFDEAISYIKSLDVYGSVLGLDNMRMLAEKLDNPEDKLKFIHVTGTNGKGSTCAFISNVLIEAGYKVGSYNSPAVLSDIDQFRINMEIIDEELYAEAVTLVKNACDEIAVSDQVYPTRFEVETMVAFVAFYLEKCDFVVLETGLGGRDDATNIVKNTLLHVFTSISLDHSQILGNTLAEIAGVKAGIIKSDSPVIVWQGNFDNEGGAGRVIEERAREFGCEVYKVDTITPFNYKLKMKGSYQTVNASVAVKACRLLVDMGYNISEENIRRGLKKTQIPFRFEKIKVGSVDIILDGAHNPDGALQFVKSLEDNYPGREAIYITGIFKDKDYERIAEITANKASKIFIIKNENSDRSLDKETLAKSFEKYCNSVVSASSSEDTTALFNIDNKEKVHLSASIEEALREAIDLAKDTISANATHPIVTCFGSLSWLKDAKVIIKAISKENGRVIKDAPQDEKGCKGTNNIDGIDDRADNKETVKNKTDNNKSDINNSNNNNTDIDISGNDKSDNDKTDNVKTDNIKSDKIKLYNNNWGKNNNNKVEELGKLKTVNNSKFDSSKIIEGVKLILEGVGENTDREGLKDTPERVARMYEEVFSGLNETAESVLSKTFSSDSKEMVIEKDITFYSMCEHHLLPFFGKAHIAYIPDGKVVGISKLARCVEVYAKKPQIQERLTEEIADAIMTYLKPKGVLVMLEAEHTCMTMRGVKKPGTKTVTLSAKGKMVKKENKDLFFQLINQK